MSNDDIPAYTSDSEELPETGGVSPAVSPDADGQDVVAHSSESEELPWCIGCGPA